MNVRGEDGMTGGDGRQEHGGGTDDAAVTEFHSPPGSPNEGGPKEAWRYYAMSLISFTVAAAALFALVRYRSDLTALGVTRGMFFITLVPVGMATALVIHGVLKGVAAVRSTQWPVQVALGGPAASAALVIAGGMWAVSESTFSLVALVHEDGQISQTASEGEVRLRMGQDVRTSPIGPDGRASFAEIPGKFLSGGVQFSAVVPGYEPLDTVLEELDPSQLVYLPLPPIRTMFRGTVLDEEGHAIRGAILEFAGGEATATTDEAGDFEVEVPFKPGQRVHLRVTHNGVTGHDQSWTIPNAGAYRRIPFY